MLLAVVCSVQHDCSVANESLLLGEPTLKDVKEALERLMEQARQRRHRYNTHQRPRTKAGIEKHQEVAEMVFLWEAVLAMCFPTRALRGIKKRLVGWVAEQHGVGRTQVYDALNELDYWQRKQLCTLAREFAREWAQERADARGQA